ncbi:MAG: leucine-rich repeat domain-containing protein [Anaeroplasma sp.]
MGKIIKLFKAILLLLISSFMLISCTTEDIPTETNVEYTIMFNHENIESQKVKKGMKATKPTDPIKDDYMFNGWYLEEECINSFDFDSFIYSDLVLYSYWIKIPAEQNDLFEYELIKGGYSVKIKNPASNLSQIVIPNSYNSFPVIRISYRGFYDCESLESIIIPNTIVDIGEEAFSNCYNLNTVIFSNKTTNIGMWAFYNCRSLTSITLPSTIKSIGSAAFSNCISLSALYYDGDIENWCSIEFSNRLSNPMFYSNGIYMLDNNGTFENNGKKYNLLTKLVIPNTLSRIEKYAFFNCNSLKSITIPKCISVICEEAFACCSNLYRVTINDTIDFQTNAFMGCYKLVEIYNLSSMSIYNGSSFHGHLEDYLKVVHKSLEEESNIITKNDFVFINTDNEYYLLNYEGKETDLILPNDINGNSYQINENTFRNYKSLISITIPNSVTSIRNYAFYECNSLTNVYYNGSIDEWNKILFSNDYSNPMYYAKNLYILDDNGTVEYNGKKYSLVEKSFNSVL